MADIKMNVFPQVADTEYIYGELADGSQIKIKKSDLLGLLFQSRGSVSLGDYNKCAKSGIYEIINGESYENGPDIGIAYGVLINYIGKAYAIQVVYEAFERRRILFRFRSEIGVWNKWITFLHS